MGRRGEAAQVRSLLEITRLLTITGPGGIGKTRLAEEVADDDAVFVPLAELQDPALLPESLADRLGLGRSSGRPVTAIILDHLRTRTQLIVLDNCEHLIDMCGDLAATLLAECPHLTILATSRQSLRISGERTLRLAPLATPGASTGLSPADLLRYDGARLLIDRATAAEPAFEVTADNVAALAEIVRQVDGLPLAIELAAARIRSLSAQQIADRLAQHGSALLTSAPRTAPRRHRTLRAAIDWSHELCSPAEQLLWRRAAIFAGSFDLDAAEQVCSETGLLDQQEVLDAVEGLLDKSLLNRAEYGGVLRYSMLATIREYGLERLADAGEQAGTARRHRDWIDRLTAEADLRSFGPDQLIWITRLRLEHANLRAALAWSLATPGEADTALHMADRLHEYWALRESSIEARGWLERALAAASPDHPGRTHATATAALHALWHSDLDAANALLDRADALAAGAPNELDSAHRAYVRSRARMSAREPGATALALEAVTTYRRLGETRQELNALFVHGIVAPYIGELAAARASLRRMLELSSAVGETYFRGTALFGMAITEVEFGDLTAAAEAATESLALARTVGTSFTMAYLLEVHAWIANRQGRYEHAATLFGAAATAWQGIGADAQVATGTAHEGRQDQTRDALGTERFDRAYARGRTMPLDEAVRVALGEPDSVHRAPAELTRREWEIADLVRQGLTNRDIAVKLTISQRTADAHVRNILTKLGFQRRAQIAAWAATARTGA